MSRNQALDALRGIAAATVLCAHTLESSRPEIFRQVSQFFKPGLGGVYLFFFISGYVIPLSAQRAASWKTFAVQRFFRVYPLFLASLIAAVILVQLGYPKWWLSESLFKIATFNLTMIQEFLGKPSILGLYWSLGYEALFYALFTVLLVTKSTQHAWRLVVLGGVVLFVLALVSAVRQSGVGGDRLVGFELLFIGCTTRAVHSGELDRRKGILAIVFGFTAVQLQWLASLYFNENSRVTYSEMFTLGVVLLTFFGALCIHDKRVPKPFVFLGAISYSLYLSHGLVLNGLQGMQATSFWVLFPATFLIAVLISTFTYRWIEKPAIAFGKRLTFRKDSA